MELTWLSAILVGAGYLALGYFIGSQYHPHRFLFSNKFSLPKDKDDSLLTDDNNNKSKQKKNNNKPKLKDPLEVEKLADILDDFKMILVVRNDLKMGKGNIAAQCSHATLGLYKKLLYRAPKALNRWEMCAQPKVVVKIESEEDMLALQERAKSLKLPTHITIDAGRTQIAPMSVKWQKELFKDVEIDTSQPPYVFKCQLFDLTGVPPDRQKIMVKGGLLKDDADWSTLGLKAGQKLMMMGTADEIMKSPEKGTVFVEDLPEEEQVAAVGHTAGLFNLGNTCYMNSTVQCLHSVPELKSALTTYSNSGRSNDVDQSSHMLTIATRDLFNELDKSVKPVAPMQFWMVLRKKYPQFGQLHNGVFMQQDAEECWTQILYTLSQSLRSPGSSEIPDPVKGLFGVELSSRIYCQESNEESSETESVYSLKCHISQEVNHLHEGLKHGLKSELEKASPALGRSAIYVKESRINALPKYLTVQFVRFFWKRESNQKAKILRKVDYPLELDVYDLCSDDLRKKLEAPRQMLRNEEGKKLGLKVKEKSSVGKENDVKMSDAEGSSNGGGEPSVAPMEEGEKEPQMTGIYDLVAVLTHKGRSADSGHYVGWVKQENGKWIEFDDDNPKPRIGDDITKLSGGGDWHMAYIIMYKARVLSL